MPEFDFEVGYRRLEAAMDGGAPEVPFIVQMHEFSMAHMGQPGDRFYTDPEVFVRGVCQTAVDYRFDTPSFIWGCLQRRGPRRSACRWCFSMIWPRPSTTWYR